MMLIPVRIMPSKIDGLGVFVTRDIPAGRTIWMYRDPPDFRIEIGLLHSKHPELLEHAKKYGYKPKGESYVEFPGDEACFINHSDDNYNLVVNDFGDMMSSKLIQAGEELLANYSHFDAEPLSGGPLDKKG